MSGEILSIAIFEPLPGKEKESLATVTALSDALAKGGFSRDILYREARPGSEYILFRYWKSAEARRASQEDPESLRCWAKLAEEIRTIRIYESLEEVARKM